MEVVKAAVAIEEVLPMVVEAFDSACLRGFTGKLTHSDSG